MFPLLGGLISGGAGLLGSIFSSETSAANTQAQLSGQEFMLGQTQQFNAAEAEKNRNFQQMMSSTAFQRARQDARAAGLNPMVLAGMGGASTPGGAQASVGTPSVPMPQNVNPLASLGDIVSKAIASANALQDFDRRGADIDLTRQQTETERWRSLDAANIASKHGLDLPEARVGAGRAQELLDHPELYKQASRSSAKKEAMGGGIVGEVSAAGGAIMDQVEKKVSPLVQDLINRATGPSGQAIWRKVRNSANRVWYGDGSGAPNIRGTTLNGDFSEGVQP